MISEDKIDDEFEAGLIYLSEIEHIIIKRALAFYMEEKKYKTHQEYDDCLFLYGDLNRNKYTEDLDKEWL